MMEKKKLTNKNSVKLGIITRNIEVRKDSINEENRTVDLTFSSEDPFERWFGIEILSHKKSAVDMSFIASGNAPFLVEHKTDDQIGVVEKAWLQESVAHARVRFGKSSRADEFFDDVRDGIRKNVSVRYSVKEMKLQKEHDDGPDEYLVTRWKPVEASLVAVPADETVGIRSADDEIETTIIRTREVKPMTPEEIAAAVVLAAQKSTPPPAQKAAPPPSPTPVDMAAIRKSERKRQADILALAKMSGIDEKVQAAAIESGESVNDFRAKAFDAMVEKAAKKPAVDMSALSTQDRRDLAGYSFTKAIYEAGEKTLSGFELEMHQEAKKQYRANGIKATGALSIPYQVLAQRALSVGSDPAGGYTVDTDLLSGSFIELLQNRMMVKQMGATVLDNLVGDIAIPGQATGATAEWEGENDDNAPSSPTFRQIALTPNRLGTYTDISKQLLMQSSVSVEQIVKNLIVESIALAIDYAALHGTGAGHQPVGIANTSGIGSVAGGTNGLAPTWAHIVELETDVAVANADVQNMGYLTNAKVRGKLKTTVKESGVPEYIWQDNEIPPGFGRLNGYKAGVSNQVSSTLTKGTSTGVCSAIFYGNWSDLILAFWGGMDMVIDPYTLAIQNQLRITANTYADVNIRHVESFSAMLDALTA